MCICTYLRRACPAHIAILTYSLVLWGAPSDPKETLPKLVAPQADNWKFKISYITVGIFAFMHLSGLYGLYLCCTAAHWATLVQGIVLIEVGTLGMAAGAHRLWSHKSYKAKLPLQIILIVFQTIGNQYSAFNWARDHRLHHRYSDTDADPHNSTRGFFFSHVGWLLVQKHPEIKKRGARIDVSDLLNNPVIALQKKYSFPFIFIFAFVLPTICPMYFWGESFNVAWHVNMLRWVLCLNFTGLINSAAHLYGNKPYDKGEIAVQNMTTQILTLGEGLHNYHHAYPWDYRASELGVSSFNLTTKFIDFFAWVGWAYDLKCATKDAIVRRANKCGDGSYQETELSDGRILNDE